MATQVASLFASIGADLSGFKRGMAQFDNSLSSGGGRLSGFTGAVGTGLKFATGVGAAGVAALGGAIIKTTGEASDMQQAMADITADLGLSGEEAAKLSDLISDLGLDPKLKVDATQAAQAIHMLGKNGLDTTQILEGAGRATVLLANSTGGDFATSADIATDVMAQFKIEANDMMRVVNGITGTTRASKFSIGDYRLALAQAGGVAASVGVDFDDFNATIAAISPLFASGSDAGTSFKTFLQRLIPQSNDAADVMRELGIITEDGANQFFKSTGELKNMTEIAGIMQTAFAGLTEEQKNNAASTIFGTDAMRAAFALADAGAGTIEKLKEKIGNTDAEAAAAVRMNTLRGQWEIFTGIVQSLSIKIGEKFLPYAQRLTSWAADMADKHGPKIVDFFGKLADGIDRAINFVGGFFQDFGRDLDFGNTKVGKFIAEIVALFTNTPIAKVWVSLWGVVKDTLWNAVDFLGNTFDNIVGALTGAVRVIRGILSGDWSMVWDGVKMIAQNAAQQLVDTLKWMIGGSEGWRGILINGLQWIVNGEWGSTWERLKSTATSSATGLMDAIRSAFSGFGPLLADMLVNPLKYAINRFIDAHNLFIRTANYSLGRLPGGFTIPEIPTPFPGYAGGGRFNKGGLAIVGERGPELVDLPAGSYVHNNAESMGMMGGSNRLDVYIHNKGTMPQDRDAIRMLAQALHREMGFSGAKVVYR